MPIQAPNEKPGDPAAARLRIDGLRPVERRGGVGKLALAVVERALAAADAAEIEAQHGKIPVREGVIELVDDRMVHGAAELRMGMQHDGDRGVLDPRGMVTAFYPAGGTGEDDLGHVSRPQLLRCDAGRICGRSAADVRLTPLAGARNCLKPLDFIGRAGRVQPAPGVRAGMADILLHDQEDKKQELRAAGCVNVGTGKA